MNTRGTPEGEEVREGNSSDSDDSGEREGKTEALEELSTRLDHSVTQSDRQEEEEVPSVPIWRDQVVCPGIAECAVMRSSWQHLIFQHSSLEIHVCFLTTPLWGHFVSPHPSLSKY